ncbi:MAG: cytochrome P450, partial [Acidimicrobiales bacterium]
MTLTDDVQGIDLLASTWGRGAPHDQFDRLRRQAPVYWHPQVDDTGFWAITKHADVRAVSHDHRTYSSE